MSKTDSQSSSVSGESACILTAADIAGIVRGELLGDGAVQVDSVAPLSRAKSNNLSFLADGRYTSVLATSSPGVLLVTPDLAESAVAAPARIVVDKPAAALLELLPRFYPEAEPDPSIHSTARIGRGATIGEGVTLREYAVIGDGAVVGDSVVIGAHSVVGNGVRIGRKSRLFPHVTVYPNSELGERVVLHSGVRIGSDGFGYVFTD
ncbi:MAG TPA: LpxD N-terminal domain-containing protein, partial [Gemmatimonadaceae bacterium]|nr:LpxD N-terminal domain-containing protein [Gemmatimonadaceae bacterium]